MSAILLAATQRDGHEVMRAAPWTVGEVVTIVTPRSADRARGKSVTHIFRTASFVLLDDDVREKVERVAAPAIATSNCPFCSTLLEHQALDRKASDSKRDTDVHGPWDEAHERYEDGTESHVCSTGCYWGHAEPGGSGS